MATQLKALLRSRISLVWVGLVIATLISWRVGTESGNAHLATIIVLLVAFAKVRFVGLWFMELREAPLALRAIFEGYTLVVCVTLIVIYFAS